MRTYPKPRLHFSIDRPIPRNVEMAMQDRFREFCERLAAVPRFHSVRSQLMRIIAGHFLAHGIDETPWVQDVEIALRAASSAPDQVLALALQRRVGSDDPGLIMPLAVTSPVVTMIAPFIAQLLAEAGYRKPGPDLRLWTALALMGYLSPESQEPIPLVPPTALNMDTGSLLIPGDTVTDIEDYLPKLRRHVLHAEDHGGRPTGCTPEVQQLVKAAHRWSSEEHSREAIRDRLMKLGRRQQWYKTRLAGLPVTRFDRSRSSSEYRKLDDALRQKVRRAMNTAFQERPNQA